MVNKYIQIWIPYAILIKSSSKIENLTYLKKKLCAYRTTSSQCKGHLQFTCNNLIVSVQTTSSSPDLSPLPVWPNFFSRMVRPWAWTVCSFINTMAIIRKVTMIVDKHEQSKGSFRQHPGISVSSCRWSLRSIRTH